MLLVFGIDLDHPVELATNSAHNFDDGHLELPLPCTTTN